MSSKTQKVQVISFLSGKGGVGKTSIALSVSHLLNDAGFKVLVIDFDLATNGASLFFKHLYPAHTEAIGIYELMAKQEFDLNKVFPDFEDSFLRIREGLYFLPSRINFSGKLPLRDSVAIGEGVLKSFLLHLIRLYAGRSDFIIIDNQAGSNLTAKVSANVSDKVIIVSELDPICSDAVDTLLIQIGEVFPEYRRHLINKLEIREIEDYKELNLLFQSMNRLPPLPFDFEVRSAFASRRIPIDMKEPTTFLIALFNTARSFLPEFKDQMDKYGEKIFSKYNQLQDRVDSLLDRKKKLEDEIEVLRRREEKIKLRTRTTLGLILAEIGIVIMIAGLFAIPIQLTQIAALSGAAVAGTSLLYLVSSRLQYRERSKDVARKENIEAKLSEINREVDRYKSLMLTRTKEFLLHFEKPKSDSPRPTKDDEDYDEEELTNADA